MKIIDEKVFNFYENEPEFSNHLFVSCVHLKKFWNYLTLFIKRQHRINVILTDFAINFKQIL